MEYPNYSKKVNDDKSNYEKFAPDSSPKRFEPKDNSSIATASISK